MKEKLTAIFQKSPCGYIGFVEELPGVNTQGKTLEEVRKKIQSRLFALFWTLIDNFWRKNLREEKL